MENWYFRGQKRIVSLSVIGRSVAGALAGNKLRSPGPITKLEHKTKLIFHTRALGVRNTNVHGCVYLVGGTALCILRAKSACRLNGKTKIN